MIQFLRRHFGADEVQKVLIVLFASLAGMVMLVAIWAVRIYIDNHPQP